MTIFQERNGQGNGKLRGVGTVHPASQCKLVYENDIRRIEFPAVYQVLQLERKFSLLDLIAHVLTRIGGDGTQFHILENRFQIDIEIFLQRVDLPGDGKGCVAVKLPPENDIPFCPLRRREVRYTSPHFQEPRGKMRGNALIQEIDLTALEGHGADSNVAGVLLLRFAFRGSFAAFGRFLSFSAPAHPFLAGQMLQIQCSIPVDNDPAVEITQGNPADMNADRIESDIDTVQIEGPPLQEIVGLDGIDGAKAG